MFRNDHHKVRGLTLQLTCSRRSGCRPEAVGRYRFMGIELMICQSKNLERYYHLRIILSTKKIFHHFLGTFPLKIFYSLLLVLDLLHLPLIISNSHRASSRSSTSSLSLRLLIHSNTASSRHISFPSLI